MSCNSWVFTSQTLRHSSSQMVTRQFTEDKLNKAATTHRLYYNDQRVPKEHSGVQSSNSLG